MEEAGINITWGGILSFIHVFILHSLNTLCTPLWWARSLTEGRVLINNPSRCSWKSIATFFAKTILPHAAPTQLHELNRMPRQCHYWGIHDFGGFGPRSPWQPCWTSLELHNNLRCFQPIFLSSLSPLLEVICSSWSDGSPSLLAPSSFSLPGISPKKFLAVSLRLGVCFTEDPT